WRDRRPCLGNVHDPKGGNMARLLHQRRLRRVHVAIVIAAFAGLLSAALVGMAVAKTLTLRVANGASVTNQSGSTKTESIVVNTKGRAVYTLSGDTTKNPKCTKANGCFAFWPPVTVSSAKNLSKQAGVKGKLGTFKRNGLIQVTLGGHPLYTFSNDKKKATATGEALHGFNGVWHVVKDPGGSSSSSTPTTTTTTSTTMSPYPGY
ncbi:MAG: COG4315 family predicted lipoprotein, partial [Solirubrobacteraceae bacterium]